MKKLVIATFGILVFALAGPAIAKDYPEFGGRCAMGVAMGTEVSTDCKTTWSGPTGDTFCFGNQQAKKDFLENLDKNMEKAFSNYSEVVKEG